MEKQELVFHKSRPERARRKRIQAETLPIRSCTTQDAFKHPPGAQKGRISIKKEKERKIEKNKILKMDIYALIMV